MGVLGCGRNPFGAGAPNLQYIEMDHKLGHTAGSGMEAKYMRLALGPHVQKGQTTEAVI